MNHDRLFKELISNFFLEFLDLFLPELSVYINKDFGVIPLDKEVFTDITSGESHEVDLVMKVQVRGVESFFLVHVETQSSQESEFPKRMFRYFSRLHEKYDLPIYPVVVFSYDSPRTEAVAQYVVELPGKDVLQFSYSVIQLNRLSWRDYVRTQNPVASALMAKMQMEEWERPKVKVECLRLLTTLKLNHAKLRLIGGFIDSYLQLNAEEMKEYEREFMQLAPKEKDTAMEIVTSWERKGIEQGLLQGLNQGKGELLSRQVRKRFGADLSPEILSALTGLTSEQYDDLGEALLDFKTIEELKSWLAAL
jgi:hypothetical protein